MYVTNPELRREYEILRASGIYDLSSQPDGAHLLTLHPVRQYGRCANPLLLTIFTLGIVPGVLPAARAFEYDLHTDVVTETCDEQKVLAEALAWSSPERRPNKGAAAPNRRFPLQADGLGEFQRDNCSRSASPAAVAMGR